jgi:hypothetical protein
MTLDIKGTYWKQETHTKFWLEIIMRRVHLCHDCIVTPWNGVMLEKLIVNQLFKNSPPLMELEGSYRIHNS